MAQDPEAVALFDLDGTMADYDGSVRQHLEAMKSPDEPPFTWQHEADMPKHIKARIRLIKAKVGFWRELPPLQLGFDLYEVARSLDYITHILTRGPKWHPPAFTEKVEWAMKHMPDTPISLVRDKGLVYGKCLVDDWPEYFMRWLEWRPRGLVVAVIQPWNKDVKHPNLIHYNGSNLDEVTERMTIQRRTVK